MSLKEKVVFITGASSGIGAATAMAFAAEGARLPLAARRASKLAEAFSILLFTETWKPSGFFLKKKPPCTISKWQHVNRKCSEVASQAVERGAAAVHSIDLDLRNRDAVQSGDEGRAANVYKGIAPLIGEDIAGVILWAVTRPAHVNIARVSLTSVNQANTLLIHREA